MISGPLQHPDQDKGAEKRTCTHPLHIMAHIFLISHAWGKQISDGLCWGGRGGYWGGHLLSVMLKDGEMFNKEKTEFNIYHSVMFCLCSRYDAR